MLLKISKMWYNIIELKIINKVCRTAQSAAERRKIMFNNNYANCVAYSFMQCYNSGIEITAEIYNDEQQLQQLKELVAEYKMALEIAEESLLMWTIPQDIIDKVTTAQNLAAAY